MSYNLFCLLAVIFISFPTTFESDGNLNYSYNPSDDNGPDHWNIHAETCSGEMQSPIDIVTKDVVSKRSMKYIKFASLQISDAPSVLTNIGSTVDLKMTGWIQEISGGGLPNTYTFYKLHFHWAMNDFSGSEHTVDGHSYPLEIHFVHWNSERYANITEALKHSDGLAVLGVFVQIKDPYNKREKASSGLSVITENLLQIASQNNSIDLPDFSYASLFPDKDDFYRYQGSLTTPPCLEVVTWTVFKNPIFITEEQMNRLRQVNLAFNGYNANFRPQQPLNDRKVYSCCRKKNVFNEINNYFL